MYEKNLKIPTQSFYYGNKCNDPDKYMRRIDITPFTISNTDYLLETNLLELFDNKMT